MSNKLTKNELHNDIVQVLDNSVIHQAENTQEHQDMKKEIANLNLQLEASQRVTNGKTFGTDFLNTFGMTIDYTKATVQGTTSSGATTVTVDNATGFQVGQEVTIYDDVALERVVISDIQGNDITFSTQLDNSYKDKANIARSMAIEDTINQCLKFGAWSTQTTYDVQDATVVSSAYDTSGNGGRKLVRLSNGSLVVALRNTGTTTIYLYKSDDNGATWAQWKTVSVTGYDSALAVKGDNVYVIYASGTANINLVGFSSDGMIINNGSIDTSQSALGNVSLAINEAGTELHATWASKNSTYPNSFNIRYAKGTINGDGSVTWGAVTQVTDMNSSGQDAKNPCVVIKDGVPLILVETNIGGVCEILILKETGLNTGNPILNWSYKSIYNGGSYAQSSPSAIFVPQSVNGLTNGRIWVAWHGRDSTEAIDHIRISYSDNGGSTWSAMEKLTSGATNHNAMTSITINKNNDVFIMYRSQNTSIASTVYDVKMLKKLASESTWTITNFTNYTANYNDINVNPSALAGVNLDFSTPLFIYKDVKNAKVGFYETLIIGTETPLIENDVRFIVQDTDEIVMWIQRDEVAGFTVDAEVNGNVMTKESVTGEDQFTHDLGSVQPTEVRLNLQRASTNDNVKVTKILGGVA